ncbi:MAG: archaemetzincin family Zn-dependent metalloprotease [Candidatus Bathyarchaeota archaeon]|jgi:archaemetzincin
MQTAILRIGTVDVNILKEVKNGLSEIYPETECLILNEALSIPTDTYNRTRQQFRSTRILERINKHVTRTQVGRILGVTEVDLYASQLNFVFGEAMCPGKAAVISVLRLKPEFYGDPADSGLFINRCIKEAVHEIGHTLGLRHCKNPNCVMFFSNSISDTDRKRQSLCDKCYSKIVKLLGVKSPESHI